MSSLSVSLPAAIRYAVIFYHFTFYMCDACSCEPIFEGEQIFANSLCPLSLLFALCVLKDTQTHGKHGLKSEACDRGRLIRLHLSPCEATVPVCGSRRSVSNHHLPGRRSFSLSLCAFSS